MIHFLISAAVALLGAFMVWFVSNDKIQKIGYILLACGVLVFLLITSNSQLYITAK